MKPVKKKNKPKKIVKATKFTPKRRKKAKFKVKFPKKVHRWVEKKLDGDDGENFAMKCYDRLIKSEDKSVDFNLMGKTVELKTDSYRMAENSENQKFTLNFFFEHISNTNKGDLSGVWSCKADYFVYLFIKDKTFFWFKTDELRERLDEAIVGLKPKVVWNKGYDSHGYVIPREDLMDICILKDDFTSFVD